MRSHRLLMMSAWVAAATALPAQAQAPSQQATQPTAQSPHNAQVQQGVDAWKAGDFNGAVRAWMPMAATGNADAQFNMGQAYKLGRGVATSLADAEIWFRRAAAQGHLQAEDNLGLILFTMNKREEAMPFVHRSAARGEARAQFLLGTAHYNGDLVEKNWPLAYALITRASETGLSLAANRITELNRLIPDAERKKGLAMLPQMRKAEEAARLAALPSSDHPPEEAAMAPSALAANLNAATQAEAPPPPAAPRTTPGVTFTPPSPSAAPRTAPPVTAAPAPRAAAPARAPAKPAAAKATTPARPAASAPAPATANGNSKWRAQLGAFSVPENARNLWRQMSSKYPELRRHTPQYLPSNNGRITRVVIGGFNGQSDAANLCANLRRAGETCLVTAQ